MIRHSLGSRHDITCYFPSEHDYRSRKNLSVDKINLKKCDRGVDLLQFR